MIQSFPDNLNKEYLETLESYPNVILNGYYFGKKNKMYRQSRKALADSYRKIYMCDFWLDGFCWQDKKSFYRVPDTRVLDLIEKYYEQEIPLGCLIIAVKHRKERHVMSKDNEGFDLIFKKKAYFDYVELYDKSLKNNQPIFRGDEMNQIKKNYSMDDILRDTKHNSKAEQVFLKLLAKQKRPRNPFDEIRSYTLTSARESGTGPENI